MKKFLSNYIIFDLFMIFAIVFSSSCRNMEEVQGNGHLISDNRNLTGFKAINCCCGLDVIITQSDKESVIVETDENLQKYIHTEVNNHTLNIRRDNLIFGMGKAKVYVNVINLENVEASSGTEVETTNEIHSELMEINVSSGSNLKMQINTKYLNCSSSSGSDITLTGKAIVMKANSSSGSEIKASELTTETCKVSVSSGSDANVFATGEMEADASSGGDVHVKGNPKIRTNNTSSGGDVIYE